ncbi:MAG: WG repeat-containing protein [Parcubacteria group bacterium]|nr:WG repeat-containing protein [Parcubacteria group bacterium]
MPDICFDIKAEYESLQKLTDEYSAVYLRVRDSGDMTEAKKLKKELQQKMDALEEKIDPYHIRLRQRVFKKLKPRPQYVDNFYNGFALVNSGDDRFVGGNRYFFVDKNGNRLNDEHYEQAMDFSEGFAAVRQNNKAFFIDTKGHVLNKEIYDIAGSFSEGRARVKRDSQWFFIDTKGVPLNEEKYDHVANFKEGLARIVKNDKHFYIKHDGSRLSEQEYDGAGSFSEGFAWVVQNAEWYYIDKKEIGVYGVSCDFAFDFSENYAVIFENGKGFFFIRRDGSRLNEEKYENARGFFNGVAAVKQNGVWFLIDKTGLPLDKERYDDINLFKDIIMAKRNNKWLIIDRNDFRLTEGKYDDMTYCGDGVIRVKQRGKRFNEESFYIDYRGREIFEK